MYLNERNENSQFSLFSEAKKTASTQSMLAPASYTGLAGFHKYWGKKPTESLSYLIENLTNEGDFVLDPFLGSGLVATECLSKNRKFIGIDVNPFSIEHTSFLLSLPSAREYRDALLKIEAQVADEINKTYQTSDGRTASHYLWEDGQIASIWLRPTKGRTRLEIQPCESDMSKFLQYQAYHPKNFRGIKFFTNSRINVKPTMSTSDVFTGRALLNIDRIIDAINLFPLHLKRALLLTLTSASGQMSNMVFAIKNRGCKNAGSEKKSRIEVGSWVIGYWIPKTHFEINVWNCFKNRADKLIKTLPNRQSFYDFSKKQKDSIGSFSSDATLINDDCRLALMDVPDESISLVCTDPPHSDRVPYLELSEMWNSLLNQRPDFDKEIVVSDAKERGKSKAIYNEDMAKFFLQAIRVLKRGGYIALFFNARDSESWEYLLHIEKTSNSLTFLGCFPMNYSATSVVQDNRKGAMKNDFILIYRKHGDSTPPMVFFEIPGWSNKFPERTTS